VSEAVDNHGVDVEPEAEREHGATVAPPSGSQQAADPVEGRRPQRASTPQEMVASSGEKSCVHSPSASRRRNSA
jgi:hypothetical protein